MLFRSHGLGLCCPAGCWVLVKWPGCLACRMVFRDGKTGARTCVPRPPKRARVRLCERQALFDAIDHGLVDLAVFAELALALGTLARSEVAKTRFTAHDLACTGHFEPLGS